MIIARYHLKNDKTRSFSMKASRRLPAPRSEVSDFTDLTTSWFGEVKLSTTHIISKPSCRRAYHRGNFM